jgi:hypothetical protein
MRRYRIVEELEYHTTQRMNTNTPETDAMSMTDPIDFIAIIEHARKLERERDAALKQIENNHKAVKLFEKMVYEARQERDEAREQNTKLRDIAERMIASDSSPPPCSAFGVIGEKDSDAEYSSVDQETQSTPSQDDPCQLAGEQPSHEYESPQVGLPHSGVHETEDERRNRLSDQRISDAKSRLCPDK